jgi:hypothetical protein
MEPLLRLADAFACEIQNLSLCRLSANQSICPETIRNLFAGAELIRFIRRLKRRQ